MAAPPPETAEFLALLDACPKTQGEKIAQEQGQGGEGERALVARAHAAVDSFVTTVADAISQSSGPGSGSGSGNNGPSNNNLNVSNSRNSATERGRVEAALDTKRFGFVALQLIAVERPHLLLKGHAGGLFTRMLALLAAGNARPPVGNRLPGQAPPPMFLASRSETLPQLAAGILMRVYSPSFAKGPDGTAWPDEFVRAVVENLFTTSGGQPPLGTPRYDGCMCSGLLESQDTVRTAPTERRGRQKHVQPAVLVEFALNVLTFVAADLSAAQQHGRFLLGLRSSSLSPEPEDVAWREGILSRLRLRYPTVGPERDRVVSWCEHFFSEQFNSLLINRDTNARGAISSVLGGRDIAALLQAGIILSPLASVRKAFFTTDSGDHQLLVDWAQRSADLQRLVSQFLVAVALHMTEHDSDIKILSAMLKMSRYAFTASSQRSGARPADHARFDSLEFCRLICSEVLVAACSRHPKVYTEICLKHLLFNEMLPSAKVKAAIQQEISTFSGAVLDRVRQVAASGRGEKLGQLSSACTALINRPLPPAGPETIALIPVEAMTFSLLNEMRQFGFDPETTVGETLAELCGHGVLQQKVGKMRVLVRRIFRALRSDGPPKPFSWPSCVAAFLRKLATMPPRPAVDQLNMAVAAVDVFCTIQLNVVPLRRYGPDRVLAQLSRELGGDTAEVGDDVRWEGEIRAIQTICIEWWRKDFCRLTATVLSEWPLRRRQLCQFALTKLLLAASPHVYGIMGEGTALDDLAGQEYPELLALHKRQEQGHSANHLSFFILDDRGTDLDDGSTTRAAWCGLPMCDLPEVRESDLRTAASLVERWGGTNEIEISAAHPWFVAASCHQILWALLNGTRSLAVPAGLFDPEQAVAARVRQAAETTLSRSRCGLLIDERTIGNCVSAAPDHLPAESILAIVATVVARAAGCTSTSRNVEDFPCGARDIASSLGSLLQLARAPPLQSILSPAQVSQCADDLELGSTEVDQILFEGTYFVAEHFAQALRCVMLCICNHSGFQADLFEANSELPLVRWFRTFLQVMVRACSVENAESELPRAVFELPEDPSALKVEPVLFQLLSNSAFDGAPSALPLIGGLIYCRDSALPLPRKRDLQLFEAIREDFRDFRLIDMICRRSPDALVSLAESLDETISNGTRPLTEYVLGRLSHAAPTVARLPIVMLCQFLLREVELLGEDYAVGDPIPDVLSQHLQMLQRILFTEAVSSDENSFKVILFFISKLSSENVPPRAPIICLDLLLTVGSQVAGSNVTGNSWIRRMLSTSAWMAESSPTVDQNKARVLEGLFAMFSFDSATGRQPVVYELSPQLLADLFVILNSEQKQQPALLLKLSRVICEFCGREGDHWKGALLTRDAMRRPASASGASSMFETFLRCLTKARAELLVPCDEHDPTILARGLLLIFASAPNEGNMSNFAQLLLKPLVPKTFTQAGRESEGPEHAVLAAALEESFVMESLLLSQNGLVFEHALKVASPQALFRAIIRCFGGERRLESQVVMSGRNVDMLLRSLDVRSEILAGGSDGIDLREFRGAVQRLLLISSGEHGRQVWAALPNFENEDMQDVDVPSAEENSFVNVVPLNDVPVRVAPMKTVPQTSRGGWQLVLSELERSAASSDLTAALRSVTHLPGRTKGNFDEVARAVLSFQEPPGLAADAEMELASALLDILEQVDPVRGPNIDAVLTLVVTWAVRERFGGRRRQLIERYVGLTDDFAQKASAALWVFNSRPELAVTQNVVASCIEDCTRLDSAEQAIFRLLEKYMLGDVLMRRVPQSGPVGFSASVGVVDELLLNLATRSDNGSSLNSWAHTVVGIAHGDVSSASDEVANRTTAEVSLLSG
jgi:hypothetical protein